MSAIKGLLPIRKADIGDYGAANGAPPCAGFKLADHSLGLVVEGGDDPVEVLFRVVKSQAADREIDDFMIFPRPRSG